MYILCESVELGPQRGEISNLNSFAIIHFKLIFSNLQFNEPMKTTRVLFFQCDYVMCSHVQIKIDFCPPLIYLCACHVLVLIQTCLFLLLGSLHTSVRA